MFDLNEETYEQISKLKYDYDGFQVCMPEEKELIEHNSQAFSFFLKNQSILSEDEKKFLLEMKRNSQELIFNKMHVLIIDKYHQSQMIRIEKIPSVTISIISGSYKQTEIPELLQIEFKQWKQWNMQTPEKLPARTIAAAKCLYWLRRSWTLEGRHKWFHRKIHDFQMTPLEMLNQNKEQILVKHILDMYGCP